MGSRDGEKDVGGGGGLVRLDTRFVYIGANRDAQGNKVALP